MEFNHLTFDQQAEQGAENVLPCSCWYAGRSGTGDPEKVQHPEEWEQGAQAKYEYDNDI